MSEIEVIPPTDVEQSLPALFGDNRLTALEQMESFVQVIASRCKGNQFVVNIDGRKYAKVEWWTAVGNSLGILPRTDSIEVIDSDGFMKRRAWVSLWRDGHPMGPRASGVCSSAEITKKRDSTIRHRWLDSEGHPIDYAIESMAITRATGKAFRQSLSILPVLAGLQPTPAEEMDSGQFSGSSQAKFDRDTKLGFGKHGEETWQKVDNKYLYGLSQQDSWRGEFAKQELEARKDKSSQPVPELKLFLDKMKPAQITSLLFDRYGVDGVGSLDVEAQNDLLLWLQAERPVRELWEKVGDPNNAKILSAKFQGKSYRMLDPKEMEEMGKLLTDFIKNPEEIRF